MFVGAGASSPRRGAKVVMAGGWSPEPVTMDFKEACHHLRIMPQLLKWYGSYAPKPDGRKLQQVRSGEFDQSELDAFDKNLRTAWPTRSVPVGIERELLIEACGLCPLCQQPCEKPQTAHIRRKDVEVAFYYQHPENLILLCGTCHDRYDDPRLKSITLDVVLTAKDRLVSRKMEAIDRDVRLARGLRDAVEAMKSSIRAELSGLASNSLLWQRDGGLLVRAAASSLAGSTASPILLSDEPLTLASLSASLQPTQQVTHAVLDGYAMEATGSAPEAPPEWDLIEAGRAEYECIVCTALKDTVDYDCQDCGHFGSNTDPPDGVEENDLGIMVPVYSDARGDSYRLACEECESENLEVSYPESLCSACSYRESKDD